MTKSIPTLYACGRYITDKESFGFDDNGARNGETPNITLDAETKELARAIVGAIGIVKRLAACRAVGDVIRDDGDTFVVEDIEDIIEANDDDIIALIADARALVAGQEA